jgi:hypothetical protein
MYQFDPDTTAFLDGAGLAAQVGSADPAGRPQVAVAWGPRENGDGTISVFLDTARAGRTLANLAMNRNIALIVADPISYRSIQFKGEWLTTAVPTEDERAWVQRHREVFASNLALVGDSPGAIRNMWMDEITRIDFTVRAAFDQTPGPRAGQPL